MEFYTSPPLGNVFYSFPSLYTGQLFFSISYASPQSSLLFTLSPPLFTFTTGSFILYLRLYSLSTPLPHSCIHSASWSIYPSIWLLFPVVQSFLHLHLIFHYILNFLASNHFLFPVAGKAVAEFKCTKLNIQSKR